MKSEKNGKKTGTADMRQRIEAGMATAVEAARDGLVVLLLAPSGEVTSDVAAETAARTPHTRYVEACGERSRTAWIDLLGLALHVPHERERIIAELRRDDVLIVDNVQSAGLKAAEFVREIYDRAGCGMVLLATGGDAPCAMLKQLARRISLTAAC